MNGVNYPFTFRCGDSQLAFGNNPRADSLSFTWTAPDKNNNENNNPAGNQAIVPQNIDGNANAGDNDNGANDEGNDRKRRRVHVEIEKHRITVLKLGSDMTFDFKSAAAESERQLADTVTERDQLQAQLTNITGIQDNLQQQCDDMKQQRDWYYSELASLYNMTAMFQADHNNLRTQHEAVLLTNDRESQKLKGEHSTLKNDHQVLKNDHEALKEQHTTLKADFENAETERQNDLEAALLEAENHEIGVQFTRANEAEEEVREVRDKLDNLGYEFDRLESQKIEAEDDLEATQSELEEAKEEIQNLKNELGEMKENAEYVRIVEIKLENVNKAKKGVEEYAHTIENKLEAETARAADYASQLRRLQEAANRYAVEGNAKSKLEVKELQGKNAAKDVQIAALEAAVKQANEKLANRWAAGVFKAKKGGGLRIPGATDNIMKDSQETRTRGRRLTADAMEKN
ncbi:hypothetical protein CKAH01_11341 [Colletotrichum kahawae]|uniref:Uncharacterized protein n=1 Tax=Colletotrichum kahawae TaxID=34407 RepID=A0AAD9YTP5_COLKA|nr:hypothetical protein CKAH01_11341 [Colletotrichum kahawae]